MAKIRSVVNKFKEKKSISTQSKRVKKAKYSTSTLSKQKDSTTTILKKKLCIKLPRISGTFNAAEESAKDKSKNNDLIEQSKSAEEKAKNPKKLRIKLRNISRICNSAEKSENAKSQKDALVEQSKSVAEVAENKMSKKLQIRRPRITRISNSAEKSENVKSQKDVLLEQCKSTGVTNHEIQKETNLNGKVFLNKKPQKNNNNVHCNIQKTEFLPYSSEVNPKIKNVCVRLKKLRISPGLIPSINSSSESIQNSTKCLQKTSKSHNQENKVNTGNTQYDKEQTQQENEEIITNSNKTHKFFSERLKTNNKTALCKKADQIKRKYSKPSNVYEFLSQSQSTDSNAIDPAADVIKKLVSDGKARLATNWKGKGKPKLKAAYRRKVRPIGKRKQVSLKNCATNTELNKHTIDAIQPRLTSLSPVYEGNHFYNDINENNISMEMPILHDDAQKTLEEVQIQHASVGYPQHKSKEDTNNSLLRSVLINKTRANNNFSLAERLKLIDFARKVVSTPVNRKAATNSTNSNFSKTDELQAMNLSPIPAPQASKKRQSIGCPSPWRVSEDVHLPQTFFFGRNNSNLPSFSSDYIPPTPRKKHNMSNINISSKESVRNIEVPESNSHNSENVNNSSCENIPPTSSPNKSSRLAVTSKEVHDIENDENILHLPNPRRTLAHRSPLKTIQIQEVLVLPPWKSTTTKSTTNLNTLQSNPLRESDEFSKESSRKTLSPSKPNSIRIDDNNASKIRRNIQDKSNLDDIEEFPDENSCMREYEKKQSQLNLSTDCTFHEESSENNSTKIRQSAKNNLFGFEEFLDEEDSYTEPADKNQSGELSIRANCNLHEKLKSLKKLRPKDTELPIPSKIPVRFALCSDNVDGYKQPTIKEMLCSTMIGRQSEADKNQKDVLFQDADPELTFNENEPHNVYVGPRRKRKQRHQFVMFRDSDTSEDDESESDKKRQKKKKYNKKDAALEAEINKFCTTFNEECQEVEKYHLIVE